MKCDVAREALSARIDGEREPVPSARVDEHVDSCADCRVWLDGVTAQSAHLHRLAHPPVAAASPRTRTSRGRWRHVSWRRWALAGVGVAQLAIGTAQALGLAVGLAHHDGMAAGGHLFNESTAWSVTLGLVMVGAAVWPTAAAGLASVLTVYAGVLAGYVIADAVAGAVTATRVLSHLPIVVGAMLAILVWRGESPQPAPSSAADEPDIMLPHNASRGRRRGHLWPTDGAA